MSKEGLTKEEAEIMDLITKAHSKYIDLIQTHPSDMPDWVNGIHSLQNVLGGRILRRDYPETFSTHIV